MYSLKVNIFLPKQYPAEGVFSCFTAGFAEAEALVVEVTPLLNTVRVRMALEVLTTFRIYKQEFIEINTVVLKWRPIQ